MLNTHNQSCLNSIKINTLNSYTSHPPSFSSSSIKTTNLNLQKQAISNLEYNFLMNTPLLDKQTLTTKLVTNCANNAFTLFSISQSSSKSKVFFKAPCPSIDIQKIRAIYFFILTENYNPIWPCQEQIETLNAKSALEKIEIKSKEAKQKDICQLKNEENKISLQKALNKLKLAFYESQFVSSLNKKYVAEFFQFLNYDIEKNEKVKSSENIVMGLLNKYPIIDEIFIDFVLKFMKKNGQQNGTLSLDDNYNIQQLMKNVFEIQLTFASNWEMVMYEVFISFAKDSFCMHHQNQNFFIEIAQNLEKIKDRDGLDVSKVCGFDQQVFKKLDRSFIMDLGEFASGKKIGFGGLSVKSIEGRTQKMIIDQSCCRLETAQSQSIKVGHNRQQSDFSYFYPKTQNNHIKIKQMPHRQNLSPLQSNNNSIQLNNRKGIIRLNLKEGIKKVTFGSESTTPKSVHGQSKKHLIRTINENKQNSSTIECKQMQRQFITVKKEEDCLLRNNASQPNLLFPINQLQKQRFNINDNQSPLPIKDNYYKPYSTNPLNRQSSTYQQNQTPIGQHSFYQGANIIRLSDYSHKRQEASKTFVSREQAHSFW